MIIFDLDGTLADCSHRRHFVSSPPLWSWNGKNDPMAFNTTSEPWKNWQPDWESFYEACDRDLPIKPVIYFAFAEIYMGNAEIWSGRCESVRCKTIEWLKEHICDTDSHYKKFDWEPVLKMRPIGDNTPDDVLKERWLDEALAQGKTIEYVFDDRPKVVRMWRRRGIFVFNCNQTDEEF